jgi:hypothetical protein
MIRLDTDTRGHALREEAFIRDTESRCAAASYMATGAG